MTDFIIEHQCPQCGAPAQLQEVDRLVRCRFCRTNSYLTSSGSFHFCLPDQAPKGAQLIYFPYWRLKGMLFSCLNDKLQQRFVDVSQQAVALADLPVSLGFRSQTQRLRFATTDIQANFIAPQVTPAQVKAALTEQLSIDLPHPILHQEFVGEALSLIYSPFYIGDRHQVMDALINRPVENASADGLTDLVQQNHSQRWPLTFIPALCPNCGWDLEGQSDALALQCTHCQSLWHPQQGRLQRLNAAHAIGQDKDSIYLPFWRIRADTDGIDLKSYADLIKIANLPKVVQAGWDQRPFYFWAPAFKIRPHNFITFSTAVTLSQPNDTLTQGPPVSRSQTINLPVKEAAESLKLTLTGFMRPREHMLTKLPQLHIHPRSALLVYLPFVEDHHELIHCGLNLAVNKNMLAHSKNL